MEERKITHYATAYLQGLGERKIEDIEEGYRARLFDALPVEVLVQDSLLLKNLLTEQFPAEMRGEVKIVLTPENVGKAQNVFLSLINDRLKEEPFASLGERYKRDLFVALGNKLLFGSGFDSIRDAQEGKHLFHFFRDTLTQYNKPVEEAYLTMYKDSQDILRDYIFSRLSLTKENDVDVDYKSVLIAINQRWIEKNLLQILNKELVIDREIVNRAFQFLGPEAQDIYYHLIASTLANAMKTLLQQNDSDNLGKLDTIMKEMLREHLDIREMAKREYDDYFSGFIQEKVKPKKQTQFQEKEKGEEKKERTYFGDALERDIEKAGRKKEAMTSAKLHQGTTKSISRKPKKSALGEATLFKHDDLGEKERGKEKEPPRPPSPHGKKGGGN